MTPLTYLARLFLAHSDKNSDACFSFHLHVFQRDFLKLKFYATFSLTAANKVAKKIASFNTKVQRKNRKYLAVIMIDRCLVKAKI